MHARSHASRRHPLSRILALAGCALATVGLGCADGTSAVNSHCPTIDSMPGDPVGNWIVTDSCQVPYARTTSGDWCSQLVYEDGLVKDGLFLGQNFTPITTDGTSTLSYLASTSCPSHECGTYAAMLVFSDSSAPTTTNFPHACLTQHMANPSCADLETQINALAMNTLPNVENLACVDDGSGGCNCTYTYTTATVAGDVGSWRIMDGLLVHYPSLPNLAVPDPTDMRIDGATMELHGHDGISLLAHDPLRNLSLKRAP